MLFRGIDSNLQIASYWKGAFSLNYESSPPTATERKNLILPSIAVFEVRAQEEFMGAGRRVNSRYEGQRFRSTFYVDHWCRNTLERDQLISYSRLTLFNKYRQLQVDAGIRNMKLIDSLSKGFDMGDRILMNHSHQNMTIQRMIDVYEVLHDHVYLPEQFPGGVISQIIFTDGTYGTWEVGGSSDGALDYMMLNIPELEMTV